MKPFIVPYHYDKFPKKMTKIFDFSMDAQGNLQKNEYDRWLVVPHPRPNYRIHTGERIVIRDCVMMDTLQNGHYLSLEDDPEKAMAAFLAYYRAEIEAARIKLIRRINMLIRIQHKNGVSV